MLVVYGSKPAWGQPDFSPFVVKLETWLRLVGIPYEKRVGLPYKAPKGKIPYVELDGEILGDSQLILETLAARHQGALDARLDDVARARTRAIRRMLEEGTYFLGLRARWIEPEGWAEQRIAFRSLFPPGLGAVAVPMIRRGVRRTAWAQGAGRHSRDQLYAMQAADLHAVEVLLGDAPFLGGADVCDADATAFAFLWQFLVHPVQTPVKAGIRSPRLLAYVERIRSRAWPEYPPVG